METRIDKSNRMGLFSWLWWADIDQEKLTKQVDGYENLPFYKSARGIAMLVCFGTATFNLYLLLTVGVHSVVDAVGSVIAPLYIFGLFMFFGHRWAMIGAMLLWTYLKSLAVIDALPKISYVHILWWALFMHQFWLAFKVEQKRRNPNAPVKETSTADKVYMKDQAYWYGTENVAESAEQAPLAEY